MATRSSSWLIYAASSGACAAINGALAKLTTTHLTSSWAATMSRILGQNDSNYIVEVFIRTTFFITNLAFNGVMWGLFTRALTLADSTVRVSVINTSSNFVLTAVLGFLIFEEELPALWWLGAALLVTGSVIIGRRDEGDKAVGSKETQEKEGRTSSTNQTVITGDDRVKRRNKR